MVKGPHAGSMHPYFFYSDSGRWPSQVYNGLSNSPKRSRPGDNNPVFQPWPTTITHVFHKVPDTCSCLNITFVRSLHTPVLPMFYCTKHIWNTAWPANFLSSWSVLGHHFWGTLQPHQIRTTSAICIFPYGTNTRKYQLHPTAKKTRTCKSSTFVQYTWKYFWGFSRYVHSDFMTVHDRNQSLQADLHPPWPSAPISFEVEKWRF